MVKFIISALFAIILSSASFAARAGNPPAPSNTAESTPSPSGAGPLQPPAPAPKETPPPPATPAPPPPPAQPIEPPAAAAPRPPAPVVAPPAGQWVYTRQYGWLWMPYEQAYTYVVPDAALAYMFVYYPAFGWRWVVAPWVLGFGVAPYWGSLGPVHFVWYARPWFRVGVPYRPYHGPGWWRPPVAPRVYPAQPRHR